MKITTERLVLVPLGKEFLYSTYEYSSDRENTRLMKYLPDESIEDTKKYLLDTEREFEKEVPEYYDFAVLCEGKHIGAVGIFFEKNNVAELGWVFNKNSHGKGYATEAALALEPLAREFGVKTLYAVCDSENRASSRVMEKMGMKLESSLYGRKNKSSPELRTELRYSKTL